MEKPVTPDKVILIVYSETTCGRVSDRGDRMTEQELRRRITASEKDGFRLLFEQYHAYVYHIVWNRIHAVGSPEDAEECVSDIFAELFRHFGEVEEGALKGYLGVLAKRRRDPGLLRQAEKPIIAIIPGVIYAVGLQYLLVGYGKSIF